MRSVKPKRPFAKTPKRKTYPWKKGYIELQVMLLKTVQERNAYQKQIAQHMNELAAAEADKRTLQQKLESLEAANLEIRLDRRNAELDEQRAVAERDALAQRVKSLEEQLDTLSRQRLDLDAQNIKLQGELIIYKTNRTKSMMEIEKW